ncbi:MAG: hypothetical protein ACXVFE_03555 [Gaiellaceae bacterium]
MGVEEHWHLEGDRFADSFNPRRAIVSDQQRFGYLKVLGDNIAEDPWLEQWANEEIVSKLAARLEIPAIEAWAGEVEGEVGALTVFLEGRKLSDLEQAGYRVATIIESALNRDQLGLMAAFDIWILNADRGASNLFVTMEEARPRVRLLDHGHVLLLPRESKRCDPAPPDWEAFVESGELEAAEVTASVGGYIRQFVSPEELLAGARTIAQVGDDAIIEAVQGPPDEFFHCPRAAITKLLIARREALVGCIEEAQ